MPYDYKYQKKYRESHRREIALQMKYVYAKVKSKRKPKNVYYDKRMEKYKVQFGINNKDVSFGYYFSQVEAEERAKEIRQKIKIKKWGRPEEYQFTEAEIKKYIKEEKMKIYYDEDESLIIQTTIDKVHRESYITKNQKFVGKNLNSSEIICLIGAAYGMLDLIIQETINNNNLDHNQITEFTDAVNEQRIEFGIKAGIINKDE